MQCGVRCNATAYEEIALKIIIVDRPKIYLSYGMLSVETIPWGRNEIRNSIVCFKRGKLQEWKKQGLEEKD